MQKKCSGFDSISSIGSWSVCGNFAASACVADSCTICVEVICYVCIVSAGYTIRCNKCIRDCSFFLFVFQYLGYCFPCFFPIISMHVKFFFEVIFL